MSEILSLVVSFVAGGEPTTPSPQGRRSAGDRNEVFTDPFKLIPKKQLVRPDMGGPYFTIPHEPRHFSALISMIQCFSNRQASDPPIWLPVGIALWGTDGIMSSRQNSQTLACELLKSFAAG